MVEGSMFRSLSRPAVFFDADDGAGAGVAPAPAPEVGAAPDAPAPDVPPADAPPADPPVPVDWEARVRDEWGGEETITNAIELQRALGTRDGIEALFVEAARALGYGDDKLAILRGEAPAPAPAALPDADDEPTIEELLADPDRPLTARDYQRLREHDAEQRRQVDEAEQRRSDLSRNIDSALNSLNDGKGVEDTDKTLVLALADRFLVDRFSQPIAPENATPEQLRAAIARGHAEFQNIVKQQAEAYIQQKGEAHAGLPQPLSGGTPAGGGDAPEPTSIKEASARVRKALGLG